MLLTGTANTACVFITTNFKSAVGRVTAVALNRYSTFFKPFFSWFRRYPSWFIDCRDQSHYQDPDLNLADIKSSHPVLAAVVGINPVNRPFSKLDPQAFKWPYRGHFLFVLVWDPGLGWSNENIHKWQHFGHHLGLLRYLRYLDLLKVLLLVSLFIKISV